VTTIQKERPTRTQHVVKLEEAFDVNKYVKLFREKNSFRHLSSWGCDIDI